MTEKDRMLQDLRRENRGLREELEEMKRSCVTATRCRDCEHWLCKEENRETAPSALCEVFQVIIRRDFFCRSGKPKGGQA